MNRYRIPGSVSLIFLLARAALAQTPTVNIDSPQAGSTVVVDPNNYSVPFANVARVWGWAIDNTSVIGPGIDPNTISVTASPAASPVYGSITYGGGYGQALYNLSSLYWPTAKREDVCNTDGLGPLQLYPYGAFPGRVGCPMVGFEADQTYSSFAAYSPGLWSFTVKANDTNSPEDTGTSQTVSNVWVEDATSPSSQLISAVPGPGASQTLTFLAGGVYDANYHTNDVGMIWVLVNTNAQDQLANPPSQSNPHGILLEPNGGQDVNGNGPCFFQVDVAPQAVYVYLVNNAGNGWLTPMNIAGGGTISNTQCALTFTAPSQTNGLQFTVNITPLGSFLGQPLDVWMASFQMQVNSNNGWHDVTPPAVTLTDNTQTSGNYYVGDAFTVTVTGPIGAPVSVVINGVNYGVQGSIGYGGTFSTSNQWGVVGSFAETWYVAGVPTIRGLSFQVAAAPVPSITININDTAITGDDIAVILPPQSIPARITLSNASGAVQISSTPAGRVFINPATLNLTNGVPGEVTITPLQPSQTAYDVQITATFGSTVAQAAMTVVDVVLPVIRNADTPGGMRNRIPPAVYTPVQVIVQPDLTGTGQSVTLGKLGNGGNNGDFAIDGAQTESIATTTTVNLYGTTQTAATNGADAGNLKLVAIVGGQNAVPSNGFSVAAIPLNWTDAYKATLTVSPPVIPPGTTAPSVGLRVQDGWASDSGSIDDLDEVQLEEEVQASGTGVFNATGSLVSGYISALTVTDDYHTIPSFYLTGAGGFTVGAGVATFNQTHVFKDLRTGATDIPMANSGYVITQTIALVNGGWQLTTSKTGAAVTANGYSSGAGSSTPNPDTVTILAQ